MSDTFWRQVNRNGPVVRPELGPCWLWTGEAESAGYGRVSKALYGEYLSHRAAYRLCVGDPGNKFVLHRCDIRRCCRPDHLYLGTPVQNTADMMARGRHRNRKGEAHPGATLTDDDVRAIRRLVDGGMMQKAVATTYHLTPQAIYLIVHRKTWKHVE